MVWKQIEIFLKSIKTNKNIQGFDFLNVPVRKMMLDKKSFHKAITLLHGKMTIWHSLERKNRLVILTLQKEMRLYRDVQQASDSYYLM